MYDMISKQYGSVAVCVLNGEGKEKVIEGNLEDTIRDGIVVIGDDYLSLSDIVNLRVPSGAAQTKESAPSPQPAPERSSKIALKVESATAASTAPTEHFPMPSKKNMVGAASAQNMEQRQDIQKGTLNNAQNPPPSVQAVSLPNLPHLPDFHFDASGCFQELKEMFNLCHKTALSKYNAVLQSLQSAQKTNSIGDKYHKLRRELLCLWEDNLTGSNAPNGVSSEDFQSCYYLLGVVALCAKDWDYGIEPLVRAKKYRLAAYAARKAEKQDLWEVLLFCSAFSKEDPGVISKELADACFQRCDITPANELLNAYQESASVSGILEDFIRYVSVKADFPMESTPSSGAYERAKQMLSGFPSQWREKTGSDSIIGLWNEYKSYSYPRCLGENPEQQ